MPRHERLAIHWGMTMAVYPFWGAVAANVGRLLTLQGNVATSQVQRRLREQYGERETVSRSVGRLLQSFTGWGVLEEITERGLYNARIPQQIDDPRVIAWLIEAYLNSIPSGKAELRAALDAKCFFPFQLEKVSGNQLTSFSNQFEIFRQGLDKELILLREG